MSSSKSLYPLLEDIYSRYPRKLGKSPGFKSAIAQCKTKSEMDKLGQAVTNYVAHIIKEGTEKSYIMYFSTFMGQWRDWLDPETGSSIDPTKPDLDGLGFE